MSWYTQCFQSGTQVVVSSDDGPHFYVHAGYGDGETHYRYSVTDELCAWLNGGPDPAWRHLLTRAGSDHVTGPGRIAIRATGPMRLPPDDNGRLAWREEARDDPARTALIDRLLS